MLSCLPGSPARPLAEGLAWLWRLPLGDTPSSGSVEIAAQFDGVHDRERLGTAGSIVLGHAGEPVEAVADFGELGRMHGRFTVLDGGEPLRRSSLGVHAAIDSGGLRVAVGPDGDWGRLTAAWVLDAIAVYLQEHVGFELRRMPPMGVIRLDDFPGTAELQVTAAARSDRCQLRRARAMIRAARRSGGVVNIAVAARALLDEEEVPLDSVWPRSIEALKAGVEGGHLEPVCHGLLHLDREQLASGSVEFREFGALDAAEAHRRIEAAWEWHVGALGRPACFVAPAWSYSEGSRRALSELGIPYWERWRPGPLVRGTQFFETLEDGPAGLVDLDYRPLSALARQGLPPVVVLHGRMLDVRHLSPRPSPLAMARLAISRDLYRLPAVEGVKWVGAGELIETIRDHDRA